MNPRPRPYRAWWVMARFWWSHHRHAGFRWYRVGPRGGSYGWWCDQCGNAAGYSPVTGHDVSAAVEVARQLVAKVGRHM